MAFIVFEICNDDNVHGTAWCTVDNISRIPFHHGSLEKLDAGFHILSFKDLDGTIWRIKIEVGKFDYVKIKTATAANVSYVVGCPACEIETLPEEDYKGIEEIYYKRRALWNYEPEISAIKTFHKVVGSFGAAIGLSGFSFIVSGVSGISYSVEMLPIGIILSLLGIGFCIFNPIWASRRIRKVEKHFDEIRLFLSNCESRLFPS